MFTKILSQCLGHATHVGVMVSRKWAPCNYCFNVWCIDWIYHMWYAGPWGLLLRWFGRLRRNTWFSRESLVCLISAYMMFRRFHYAICLKKQRSVVCFPKVHSNNTRDLVFQIVRERKICSWYPNYFINLMNNNKRDAGDMHNRSSWFAVRYVLYYWINCDRWHRRSLFH